MSMHKHWRSFRLRFIYYSMCTTSTLSNPPTLAVASLFDRTTGIVASHLGVSSLGHRSALLSLGSGPELKEGSIAALYGVIAENWAQAMATGSAASKQNWRW